MSRLEELIQKLCPDGVEYCQLSTLADISTGSHNTNEELDDGAYPFFEYIQKTAVNSSVTSVRRTMLNKYPVPVPPLEVQREIVRIL